MTALIIDMPHTPDELAESFAKRDIEIDIRDLKDEDVPVLASFLQEHGFKAVYHESETLCSLIDAWRSEYGILVGERYSNKHGVFGIGANPPDRYFGKVRFAPEDALEIISGSKNIEEVLVEDFESVFN